MCFSGLCVNDVVGVSEFTYISVKLCPFILTTNDNNSKILRSIPSPSTGIKDLSENSAARLPGHGWGYLLSSLSNASTFQLRHTGSTAALLALLSLQRQGNHCYQLGAEGAEHLFCREERWWERLALLCFSQSWTRRGPALQLNVCREQSLSIGSNRSTGLCCCSLRCAGCPRTLQMLLDRVVLTQRLLGVGLGDL